MISCRDEWGRRTVEPEPGRGRNFGRYFGMSTAAPPITSPGINAASSKAAPASTDSPTVRYSFTVPSSRVERTKRTPDACPRPLERVLTKAGGLLDDNAAHVRGLRVVARKR